MQGFADSLRDRYVLDRELGRGGMAVVITLMKDMNARLIRDFYAARDRGDRAAIRDLLAEDVAWHDPYPPPHGGDLVGRDAVLRDVFDAAGQLTGGTNRLWLENVFATDRHASALIGWSSTFRGKSMTGREIAVFHLDNGRIVEAWFYPEDPAAALAFFG